MKFSFIKETRKWVVDTFGKESILNKKIRNERFLEECLELVQSCNMTKDDASKILDYVYSRPKGKMEQEVGGVMVTFAAHASCYNYDPDFCGKLEIARCWKKQEEIRQKNSEKPNLQ